MFLGQSDAFLQVKGTAGIRLPFPCGTGEFRGAGSHTANAADSAAGVVKVVSQKTVHRFGNHAELGITVIIQHIAHLNVHIQVVSIR